jgi:hypothetical protein
MPVVFRHRGFKYFFDSNEGREPIHVHVERDDIEAKFWLFPVVRVAYNDGYSTYTLRELAEVVEANRDRIVESWNEHFRS